MDYLSRLRRGEPKALDTFVRTELPKVFALLTRLTRNPAEAEDLSQETLIKAVKNLPRFKGDAKPSTWLYRIAVNTWKNKLRYDRRRRRASHFSLSQTINQEEDAPQFELKDDSLGPEDLIMQRERARSIYAALDQLEEDEKSIIVLRDVDGRTYEEIADILDLNIGTVKSRLSRAREALRQEHKKTEEKLV